MAASDAQDQNDSQASSYPPARRDTAIVENIFSHSVPDPYRWLEDPDSDETRAFVDAQNRFSHPYYSTPLREQFYRTLTEAYNYPKQGLPTRQGDRWVSWYNPGLQNQPVLHVRNSPSFDEEPRILIDPNKWSEDGTAAVGAIAFTEDGSLLAYARSDKGSDWVKIYFVVVEDGSQLPDVVEHVRYSCLAWAPDNSGLFYNAYDVKQVRTDWGTENDKVEFQKVYFHRLGTKQDEDLLIHQSDEPDWIFHINVTWDQRYLIMSIHQGCAPEILVWIANIDEVRVTSTVLKEGEKTAYDFSRLKWKEVVTNFDARYEYVTNEGSLFYFLTDKKAPRNQISVYDLESTGMEESWRVHVPEGEHVLEHAAMAGDKLVLQYLVDVTARLHIRNLADGVLLGEIPLPVGTVTEISCERRFTHLLFRYESFNTPGIIYSTPLQSPAKNKMWEPEILHVTRVPGLDLGEVAVQQLFYEGKDGARIPLFLVHSTTTQLTSQTPMLLTGYGGFQIVRKPTFRVSAVVAALHLGMAYAEADIRGGGEYGKEWYESAIKTRKQVSLDDFQQAATYLIEKKFTSADKLAIQGGSNGGFLVAACANQRPDLFKAVVCQVGVLDLTRFHKFTIGAAWTCDYGDPGKEDEFNAILKISPLHNIRKPGRGQYPAFFLLTADHDDRVAPLHSLKFTAELQHVFTNDPSQRNPLLIRVETNAGHGAGKPTAQRLKEAADIYGFLGTVLDLRWEA